jgi:NADH-quinone oxidoreductase subunit A
MPVFLFFCVALIIATTPLIINCLIYRHRPVSSATAAPYECGFTPFSDARIPIAVQYIIIALLFLLFDLEMAFLFPWALTLRHGMSLDAFFSGMFFFAILLVGLLYEWRQGVLQWQ